MPLLTPTEALAKRTQLCEDGFCVIPSVMPADLLADMVDWTTGVFQTTAIDDRVRYQVRWFSLTFTPRLAPFSP